MEALTQLFAFLAVLVPLLVAIFEGITRAKRRLELLKLRYEIEILIKEHDLDRRAYESWSRTYSRLIEVDPEKRKKEIQNKFVKIFPIINKDDLKIIAWVQFISGIFIAISSISSGYFLFAIFYICGSLIVFWISLWILFWVNDLLPSGWEGPIVATIGLTVAMLLMFSLGETLGIANMAAILTPSSYTPNDDK